jgi:predicted CXXCH cytochrome family protein
LSSKHAGRVTYTDPSPHVVHEDAECACHSSHTSTSPSQLIRYPGATVDTVCDACHAPATSLGEFLDPQAKSKHALAATVSPEAQFTCNTCHRPLKTSTEPTANLMLTNSESPCVVVTDTPAGDAFCYKCHGTGSTLPMGDLSGFENSAHSNVAAPPTGAGIKCDACHESHSSRNEDLNKYSGYMMCVECHNSAQADPNAPDMWSRLTQNSAANAKHPLLPQDQVNGARMTCQNCHNTHASTATNPLVDPHNPSPSGVWTTPLSDQKDFCFTCHNGQALPTSQETTPWASAVLASGGATTVADIKDAYAINVHGQGQRSGSTTTTAFLRPDMGYHYGDVLQCSACHDPHGTVNNFALLQNVKSADGGKSISGVAVAPVPSGGYDLRFFCGTCHAWDSSTHDSMAGTSTVSFPMDCTACHSHVRSNGTPSPNL